MAARITRAKKKIAAARIPYRVPPAAELPGAHRRRARPSSTCCSPPGTPRRPGPALRAATWSSARSTWPGCCALLLPDDAEVAGLLALILLTDARRATRIDADGRLLLLAEQDRSRWDRAAIAEGIALVREALRRLHGRLERCAAGARRRGRRGQDVHSGSPGAR